ncbi:MAG: NAD(P)/FAD-dependent oxidoreductase [Oligoflexia bacterium]|nr:NAD(P)/FAD-dependent oxidoreductase [Oligoflexia bacterium]
MEKKLYDISVIGAGPVGLFAVFYAGMRQMSINLIDSLDKVGGQLNALYPEKYIYDMPGFPKVMAKDLVNSLWKQAEFAKPDLNLNKKVTKIHSPSENKKYFTIACDDGSEFESKTVVLALGMGAFQPRKLEAPGLLERETKTVHYFIKPLSTYQDQRILVVGGGDSAADWTHTLSELQPNGKSIAKSVTLIHRTDKFAAHEATIQAIRTAGKVDIHTHTEIKFVENSADNTSLNVQLVQNLTKEESSHEFDHIIICAGYLAKLDFVKESGLQMQGNAIQVNDIMETNIPGIFAIGDVCTHKAKLKLIATGVGEAAIAANFAKVHIDPTSKAFPGHSTSKFGH